MSSTASEAGAPQRIDGLDGLRAVAVLAVVAYHLNAPWMPGGFLGVDLFMVLSGYLITRLLLQESDRTAQIDVPAFWIRRAKRLLPAAVTLVLVVTGVAALVFSADQLGNVRIDALAATFYVANWRFILAKSSYFDLFSEASPFRHLWSLAIEEQFYVLWPVVVLAVRRRLGSLLPITGVLVVASAVWMWALARPGDPSRAYYGTDTRAQTLLVGCLLAMLLNRSRRQIAPRVAGMMLVAALALMVVAFVIVRDSDFFMYRGGFLAFALISAACVGATALSSGQWIVRALDRRLLSAIGKGSYSIYLWHWPAIVFLSPQRLGVGLTATNLIRIGSTAVVAFVSYRFIESPIRHRRMSRRSVGLGVLTAGALTAGAVIVFTMGARAPADYFSASGQVVLAAPARGGGESVAPRPTVLVLGDSVVASLSDVLVRASDLSPITVAAAPVSGCGLLPGVTLDTTTQAVYEPSRGCEAEVNTAISAAIAQVRPDVVVWMSVWDAENRNVNGVTIALETPQGRDALYGLIDARVQQFAAQGITTVLVSDAPVGQSGTLAEPQAIKQQRILAYDDVLRRYAADHPDVGLVDLSLRICPTGIPCSDVAADGEPYRPNDGIHYQGAPALEVATWIVAELAAKTSD